LRTEDGRGSREKERQNRRAIFSGPHFALI
jgi:hypothetical protein